MISASSHKTPLDHKESSSVWPWSAAMFVTATSLSATTKKLRALLSEIRYGAYVIDDSCVWNVIRRLRRYDAQFQFHKNRSAQQNVLNADIQGQNRLACVAARYSQGGNPAKIERRDTAVFPCKVYGHETISKICNFDFRHAQAIAQDADCFVQCENQVKNAGATHGLPPPLPLRKKGRLVGIYSLSTANHGCLPGEAKQDSRRFPLVPPDPWL